MTATARPRPAPGRAPSLRLRGLRCFVALPGLLLGSAQALELRTATDLTDPAQVASSRAVVDEVLATLPPAWKASLHHRVAIEWRDDLPAGVHGRALGDRILLRRELLDRRATLGVGVSTGHADERAAVAALIHELAHLHDRSPAGGLSRDPRLLDLAGWQVGALGNRGARNTFTDRSPDRYELTRPAEYVAVNLEHFLLDPQYACRRPALARHFAAHFGTDIDSAACATDQVFVQSDVEAGARTSPVLELDPARIHAVDYLLAEPDDRVMSRWGHGMLRLVVCAPGRTPGPDCRLDIAHHQVLSFRAFVDDVQVSSWRGLTGSYPSRLFVLPMSQVIDEYTRTELRGLRSVPLRLERTEIATLLERAAQLHWNYDGRYYFVSNNCAVETFRLLHDGVPRLARMGLASLTPTGLLARLERAGIADASVLDEPAEALRLGYRFDSQASHYQSLFDTARGDLQLPVARVQDWFELAPARRAAWIDRAGLRAAAALLVLEGAALRRQERDVRDRLKRRLASRGSDGDRGAGVAIQDTLRLADRLTRPATLLGGSGYGLPQQAERATLRRDGAGLAAELQAQQALLHEQARRWLPADRLRALDTTADNLRRLGDRLRALHREGGGTTY